MKKLVVFNNVTLDGYFTDRNGDMSWAHKDDPEWNAFAADNAKGGGTLLFGRITYEMMASWWPTPQAMKSMPAVAERMNHLPKVVFSRTLDKASWNNTKLVKKDIAADESFTTMALSINFFRPVWQARLRAETRVINRGKRVGYLECDVTDQDGKLVAKANSTCFVLHGGDGRER